MINTVRFYNKHEEVFEFDYSHLEILLERSGCDVVCGGNRNDPLLMALYSLPMIDSLISKIDSLEKRIVDLENENKETAGDGAK